MKNLTLTISLFLIANYSMAQKTFDGPVFFNVNTGIALSNKEQNFVQDNNYDVKSLNNNQISFFEISIYATNYASKEGKYLKNAGNLSFKYFYPVHSNDSVKTKYSGNLFGFDIVGFNFLPRKKWVDFVIASGINMGSKKVRIDRNVKYKNWIFAPRIYSELRFVVDQKLAISLKAETQYDITQSRFKLKKGDNLLNLEGFNYSPILFSAGIGWKL